MGTRFFPIQRRIGCGLIIARIIRAVMLMVFTFVIRWLLIIWFRITRKCWEIFTILAHNNGGEIWVIGGS